MNSKKSARSRGAVIFAFNTPGIDYMQVARQNARLIQHHLQIPVTVITNDLNATDSTTLAVQHVQTPPRNFRNHGHSDWHNSNRYQAYELSPYDETLLLDADYVILDANFHKLLDTCVDYRLIHHNINVSEPDNHSMGITSLPHVWATAVVFVKSPRAKLFFDFVGKVQRNYDYYQKLYNIGGSSFRNDFAFAIANSVLQGYELATQQSQPWSMITVTDAVQCMQHVGNNVIVRCQGHSHVIAQQSLHVLDKQYLQSPDFVTFVDHICHC